LPVRHRQRVRGHGDRRRLVRRVVLGRVARHLDHAHRLHDVRRLLPLLVARLQQDELDRDRSFEELVTLLPVVVAEESDRDEPALRDSVLIAGILQLLLETVEQGVDLELLAIRVRSGGPVNRQ